MVETFQDDEVAHAVAFRGGTAFFLEHEGHRVSRAEFEVNLKHKLSDSGFTSDLGPLLAPGTDWNLVEAARWVEDELVARLPGEPWKGRRGRRGASEG